VQVTLRARPKTHLPHRDVRPMAVVDQIEGHHAERPDGLVRPVDAPTDVLRRVHREHLAGGSRFAHQEPDVCSHLGAELHLIQPGGQALRRGDHAEERLAGHIDLRLELDPRVSHA